MKDVVLIKGNQHGLSIILDSEGSFQNIKNVLKQKMISGKQFFGNAKVTLTFEGRTISEEEQAELIEVIQDTSELDIICIVDDDQKRLAEKMIFLKAIAKEQEASDLSAIFYNKTLRSGQELNTDKSVIIMGDVNNGAKVMAGGHIIVLGNLKGFVHAGTKIGEKAFVVALNMQPIQIRVGDIFGRAPDANPKEKNEFEAKIAFVEEGRIVIEKITNTIYKELNLS